MTEEFLKLFEKKIKKAFRQESLNRRKKRSQNILFLALQPDFSNFNYVFNLNLHFEILKV